MIEGGEDCRQDDSDQQVAGNAARAEDDRDRRGPASAMNDGPRRELGEVDGRAGAADHEAGVGQADERR